jgi:hypothetical protein
MHSTTIRNENVMKAGSEIYMNDPLLNFLTQELIFEKQAAS